MPSVSFDGQNLKVQLSGSGTYDTQSDIYSAWKEWVAIGDNAKYPPAFDTTGGDATGGGQSIAPYFFLRNDLGWKVRAPEQDGEVTVQGNLFPRDPNLATFEQATGFDAFIRLEVSTRAVVVETGTSGLTSNESSQLSLINGIQTLVNELHKINGLDSNNPMTVTPTGREVGGISQAFNVTADQTIVSRD